MPHTVHLAAIKVCIHTLDADAFTLIGFQLLEGIGAISNTDSKKATSRGSNYQDSATAPVDHQFDNKAIQQDDEDNEDNEDKDGLISAITKVLSSFFFLHLRLWSLINFSYE
jgi:hypothetical protein